MDNTRRLEERVKQQRLIIQRKTEENKRLQEALQKFLGEGAKVAQEECGTSVKGSGGDIDMDEEMNIDKNGYGEEEDGDGNGEDDDDMKEDDEDEEGSGADEKEEALEWPWDGEDGYYCNIAKCNSEVVEGVCHACGVKYLWTEKMTKSTIGEGTQAIHPDRSLFPRGTTPLFDIDPKKYEDQVEDFEELDDPEHPYHSRRQEFTLLLERGVTPLMCTTFNLSFSYIEGIYAYADEQLCEDFPISGMREGDIWKIHLGRRVCLDDEDEDGSDFIEGLLEDAMLFPYRDPETIGALTHEVWETVRVDKKGRRVKQDDVKGPSTWVTRLKKHHEDLELEEEEEEEEVQVEEVEEVEGGDMACSSNGDSSESSSECESVTSSDFAEEAYQELEEQDREARLDRDQMIDKALTRKRRKGLPAREPVILNEYSFEDDGEEDSEENGQVDEDAINVDEEVDELEDDEDEEDYNDRTITWIAGVPDEVYDPDGGDESSSSSGASDYEDDDAVRHNRDDDDDDEEEPCRQKSRHSEPEHVHHDPRKLERVRLASEPALFENNWRGKLRHAVKFTEETLRKFEIPALQWKILKLEILYQVSNERLHEAEREEDKVWKAREERERTMKGLESGELDANFFEKPDFWGTQIYRFDFDSDMADVGRPERVKQQSDKWFAATKEVEQWVKDLDAINDEINRLMNEWKALYSKAEDDLRADAQKSSELSLQRTDFLKAIGKITGIDKDPLWKSRRPEIQTSAKDQQKKDALLGKPQRTEEYPWDEVEDDGSSAYDSDFDPDETLSGDEEAQIWAAEYLKPRPRSPVLKDKDNGEDENNDDAMES